MTKLVFWHGWGMSPDAWAPLIDSLQTDFLPDVHYQAQILPGYANAEPVSGDITVLVDLLMRDAPEEPFVLCGWSMGSLLALQAAQRYPDRIERLVLFSSTPCFMKKPDWIWGMEPDLMDNFMRDISHDMMGALRRFVALFNRRDAHAHAISRQLSEIHPTNLTVPVLESGLELLRDTDLRSIIPEIFQKCLLVHGEYDPLMPLDAAKWLKNTLPNAFLSVLPRVAHAPFLSEPLPCCKLMKQFLN